MHEQVLDDVGLVVVGGVEKAAPTSLVRGVRQKREHFFTVIAALGTSERSQLEFKFGMIVLKSRAALALLKQPRKEVWNKRLVEGAVVVYQEQMGIAWFR